MQAVAETLRDAFDATEGMVSFEEFQLLHALAREVRHGCIVEVGSYRGRSTVALALGAQAGHGAPVYAIEPHEPFVGVLGGRFGPDDRAAFFRAMLDTGGWRSTRLVNLTSEQAAAAWIRPIGLLWIDGDHSEEGVRRDFHAWLPHLADGAKVAFDDSIDRRLAPARLVARLVDSGTFTRAASVGKVTVLDLNAPRRR